MHCAQTPLFIARPLALGMEGVLREDRGMVALGEWWFFYDPNICNRFSFNTRDFLGAYLGVLRGGENTGFIRGRISLRGFRSSHSTQSIGNFHDSNIFRPFIQSIAFWAPSISMAFG